MLAMNPNQFLEHTFKGASIPVWVNIRRDPTQIIVPRIHPAFGMRRGEVRVHDGIIFEYVPDGSRIAPFLANVETTHQPNFQIGEISSTDDSSYERMHEEHERYSSWLANHSGRDLSEEKRTQQRDDYHKLINYSRQLEMGLKDPQTVRKGPKTSIAQSLAVMALMERQRFSDQFHRLSLYNPLRNIADEHITPDSAEDLEKAYEEVLKGSYLRRDQVRARMTDSESWSYRIGREEKYYKEGRAFYRYREGLSFDFQDPNLWLPLYPVNGTTWTYGEPEFIHYEFRVYTAEHTVLPLDWEAAGTFPDLKHISVVAGAWMYIRRKATANIWENGQIKEKRDYTRYEERFLEWLIGNGCASTYLPEDELVLKDVTIFYNYEDLQHFAFGVTPTEGEGRYFPIRAVAYCVGTYGIDWVCHQLANAFCLRRWNIIVVHNSPFETMFGLTGRKGIAERQDRFGGIHHGCIPGNYCFYTMVPPYATDPTTSATVELLASGAGWNLDYFWNPRQGEYVPTQADYKEQPIPFSGPHRVVTEPGWNP
jgi:hypothetical protein